jgi:outer membrane lipoprotein-sorting protein
VITRNGKHPDQQLLTTDRQTLLNRIARQFAAVRNFSATVDLVPALGSAEKSRITEYKDVRAYILFRTPNDIRIIGLYPVVRNKAFDMVSTGPDFRLYIPAKSRLITGRNDQVLPDATNKLYNLRPQHFLEALIVRPPDVDEKPVLENLTDEDDAAYIIHLVRTTPDGQMQLSRSIWFDRLNLLLARELVYDPLGNILTDARYSEWKSYDNIAFPSNVVINRPRDEYGVVLTVVKMDINQGVSDDKFVLQQPEGTQLQVLGESPQPPAPKPSPPEQKKRRRDL